MFAIVICLVLLVYLDHLKFCVVCINSQRYVIVVNVNCFCCMCVCCESVRVTAVLVWGPGEVWLQ